MKKNHHYVPQLYLRGFLDPLEEAKGQNVLWCYAIGKKPKRFPTSRVGCKEFFYAFEKDGETQLLIEDKLAEMERIISGPLQKLAAGDIRLAPQERSELAGFLALMFSRGERAFDFTNKLFLDVHAAKTLDWLKNPDEFNNWIKQYEETTGEKLNTDYDRMKEFMEKVASGEIRGEQTERGWTLKIMMELMVDMIPLFEGMSWGLLSAGDDEMFLTSDNPVVVSDPKASMNERRVQYSNMASFTFPINRKHCLQGINEGGSRPRDGRQALRSAEVRMTNRMVAEQSYKFLYAPMRSDHIQGMMEKVYKQRRPILPSLPKEILDMMVRASK
jgi:hypothetical protein